MTPYYEDGRLTVWAGDCIDVMAALEADTFDSVVTDPPYGIGFMGHRWDQPGVVGSRRHGYERPNVRGPAPHPANEVGSYDQSPTGRRAFQEWCETWGRAAFRVAKPGAWLLSFGSPRSHHRLVIGLEDAGWEITDELAWLFAQGMSKGKSTLKPAHEPIVLARRPGFFLIPKANRAERNAGLEDLEEQPILWSSGTKSPGTFQSPGTKRAARNHHPTIKPLALMEHLVRLVTPPGGVCLDPFLGSGTTAVAAVAIGRQCVGIEREADYLPIISRRLRLLRTEAVS